MKRRYNLLVTLALAISVVMATWTPVYAGDSPQSAVASSTLKPGTKPGAQPTTGEPDNGGTSNAPTQGPQVQRLGQLIAQNWDSPVLWQFILQWLLENAAAHPMERAR